MSNSALVSYTNLTKNYSRRTEKITKITIHHAAGKGTAKSIVDSFIPASRKASANYVIGNDGQIGQSVLEQNRAWTSSSSWNDNKAVTIEVSNDTNKEPWSISQSAYASLIKLCVDICQRNGIYIVNYTGDSQGVLTEHRMYAKTACPGTTIHELLRNGTIVNDINKQLNASAVVPTKGTFSYDGLEYSSVFDPTYYAKRYPDLGQAGLKTDNQLFQHFILCGMNEFRQGNAEFNPVAYSNANEDLKAVFADDREAYYKHYIMCGKSEIAKGLRKQFM